MIDKALGMLRHAVIAVFVAALVAGMALPLYTDEVGWRFQERAGFDGVDKMFSDGCGPNTLAAPPFFMMPVRWYSALFNGAFADPFWVRASGVLHALAWVALVLLVIRTAADGRRERGVLGLLGFGLLGLGMTPLLMVWSRPEQPVILSIAAAVLLALGWWKQEGPTAAGAVWRRAAVLLLLALVAVSYHLKGIFAVPLFLACLFLAAKGRRALPAQLAAAAGIIGATGLAARYWIARFQCPDDAILRGMFARNNFGAELTGLGDIGKLTALAGKLIDQMTVLAYVRKAAPKVQPLSRWLPADQVDAHAAWLWSGFMAWTWGVALAVAGVCLLVGAWRCWRARRLDARAVLALGLLAVVLAWSMTQRIRNVYEAGFVLPLLALAVVLAVASAGRLRRAGMMVAGVALLAGVAGAGSIAVIAATYGPYLLRASGQAGYLPLQPTSVPVFGYSRVRQDIAGVARQCGIPRDATARAVMIDDTTYFAMMHTRLPQHRLGVTGLWRGEIADPVAYLKSRGSSGIVVGCHLLPPDLRARAKAQGMFCCLGPPNW